MDTLSELSPLALAVCGLLASVALLYVAYPDRYATTRARPDLPGPAGIPILGNLSQVLPWHRQILGWFKQLQSQFGAVCTFTLPPWGRGILISKPEWLLYVKQSDMKNYSRGPIARRIFREFPGAKTPVASEGAQWRLARRSMYPIFTVKSFTEHVSYSMNIIVPVARKVLNAAATSSVPIDWNDLAGRIALSIFTHSAFDMDLGDLEERTSLDPPSLDVQNLRSSLLTLNLISARRLFNPFWYWTELITGEHFRFNQARSYVRDVVESIVRSRREGSNKPSSNRNNIRGLHADFLSSLLQDPSFDDPLLIRDILVTLLFAGRDNTQNVLAWGLHALMENPKWIHRMRVEATSYTSPNQVLQYEDLSKYPVHLAVFYETVRLWPGLPKNARLALNDDVLPALPQYGIPEVKIEKGDYIFWSDYLMMRDETIWGLDASVFDPGRHLTEDGEFVRPALPNFNGFGAGPRLCPASQLATYEFVACMAGILPFFDFTPSKATGPDGPIYTAPTMAESFTSSLSGPLWVDVKARSE